MGPELFRERLASQDVVLSQGHPDTGRFAMQVNPTLLRVAEDTLAETFAEAAAGGTG